MSFALTNCAGFLTQTITQAESRSLKKKFINWQLWLVYITIKQLVSILVVFICNEFDAIYFVN